MNIKATPAVVSRIKSARKRGATLRAIAKDVGVSHETVRNVIRFRLTLADAAKGKGKA